MIFGLVCYSSRPFQKLDIYKRGYINYSIKPLHVNAGIPTTTVLTAALCVCPLDRTENRFSMKMLEGMSVCFRKRLQRRSFIVSEEFLLR